MLLVHGASCPSKRLQDRYLAKFMACRRTSFALCYIIFKTRITFKEAHKERSSSAGTLTCQGSQGWICEGIHVVDEWDRCGGEKAQNRDRVHPAMVVTRHSSLCQRLTSTNFGSTVAMCLSAKVVARSSRPTTSSTDKRSLCLASLTTGKAFATSPCYCGARTTIDEIILNSTLGGRRRGKGPFWPAPGRRQISFTISIGIICKFNFQVLFYYF